MMCLDFSYFNLICICEKMTRNEDCDDWQYQYQFSDRDNDVTAMLKEKKIRILVKFWCFLVN